MGVVDLQARRTLIALIAVVFILFSNKTKAYEFVCTFIHLFHVIYDFSPGQFLLSWFHQCKFPHSFQRFQKLYNFKIKLASVKVLVHNATMRNGANKKIRIFSIFSLQSYTFFFWISILYEKCVRSFEVHHVEIAKKLRKLKGGS